VRSMILVLSLVLGLLPLAGVGWILANGMIIVWPPSATVDGLFMSLILLALSLCFLLNAYLEARDQGLLGFLRKKKELATAKSASPASMAAAQSAKTPAAKANS
jgi:hypothetical protein